jgi:hypothetical protein
VINIYNLETVYRKGSNEINEDALVSLEDTAIYSVIDGATGLGGLSGSIASNIIKKAIIEEEGKLLNRILKGNILLGQKAVEEYGDKSVEFLEQIPKNKRSSCGIAAIQLDRSGYMMDYVTAGDCMIFLQFKDKKIRQLTFDLIDRLDATAIQMAHSEWRELLANELEDPNEWGLEKIFETQKKIRFSINETLIKNRNKMNTQEGYGIIDGSDSVKNYLEYGTVPLVNVKKILLLSDGMKIHSHRQEQIENEWLHTAEIAFEHGLAFLEKTILDIEEKDPSCYQYPRLKQHDDKSGILLGI